MKATDIKIGKTYEVTAGRNRTKVKVTNFNAKNGSWECETESGKTIAIKDVKRFLAEVGKNQRATGPQKASPSPNAAPVGRLDVKRKYSETKTESGKGGKPKGQLSGINAAYEVLKEAGEPMNIKAIMEKINERGLAKLEGKTPGSTISAALQMEIKRKGDTSRFVKAGKGLFRAK